MIIVSGHIAVDPAESQDFLTATESLIPATRAEPGNTSYGFYPDPQNPGTFRVYEEWADDDALNGHMASPHMAEFLGSMGNFTVTSVDLVRHDVSNSLKFM